MNLLIERLSSVVGADKLRLEEPMSAHTTFRIGGPAEIWIEPDSEEKLCRVIGLCREAGVPYLLVGNGSNLLVSDSGVRGVVICTRRGLEQFQIDGNCVTAGAGMLLSRLAANCCRAGLGGVEFAAGIPGTVGGAVVMNAGAYGGEMKQILEAVHVLMPDGSFVWIPVEDMEMGYRTSCIPACGGIVTAARFRLGYRDPSEIRAQIDELTRRRKEKQPLEFPSAGSAFKRPAGYYAGKLIQDAGLAGLQVGGAQVSARHCGFVINCGGATAADVLALCERVQAEVYRQFGVSLEMEIRKIGL